MQWGGTNPVSGLSIFGTGSGKAQATLSTTTPAKASAQQRAQAGSVLRTLLVTCAADNTPQSVPGINVPDGCVVRARANNGTTAGNAAVIYIGQYRDAFPSHATPLAPLDDVQYQVGNLSQCWIYGKTGDGVVFSIVNVVS